MNDTNSGASANTGGQIRAGDYVGSGAEVFSIADLSTVWVYAHVYDDELQYVSEGLPVELELDYMPGRIFEGTVDTVYPFLDRQTRDIKIRMVFPNPENLLMPGMFGTARIENRIAENALLIPSEAVIYSGDSRIVFLALPGGRFAPQEVTLGVQTGDGKVQVLQGLIAGQSIVTSAQFLLDSESRLREAINKMTEGSATTTGTGNGGEAQNG
jgi:Cu(I)/Ag(I) efflux system membrane fusion protein/cobalt-zinc-cadmium efflux system membrane fusion protein